LLRRAGQVQEAQELLLAHHQEESSAETRDDLATRIEFLINTATQHLHSGRAAEALSYAQRSTAIEPNNVEGRIVEARALLALGRAQEAAEALQQLGTAGLAVSDVRQLLAEAYTATGDLKKAAELRGGGP
jgi:predicted Zn-dependent protease